MLSSASRASIMVRFAKAGNIADIQGKGVSQFTASTLMGVGIGLGLTKLIDITSLYHVVPTFLVLSAIQGYTTIVSCKIVDETHLNNQRANLVFTDYFNEGKKQFKRCDEINVKEIYYLPDPMNKQKCNFIKYGENSIGSILTESRHRHYADSMLHQLEKLEKDNRKFVYYVKSNSEDKFTDKLKYPLKRTKRDYTIHFNLEKGATANDVLQSYYLGRLMDYYI